MIHIIILPSTSTIAINLIVLCVCLMLTPLNRRPSKRKITLFLVIICNMSMIPTLHIPFQITITMNQIKTSKIKHIFYAIIFLSKII